MKYTLSSHGLSNFFDYFLISKNVIKKKKNNSNCLIEDLEYHSDFIKLHRTVLS